METVHGRPGKDWGAKLRVSAGVATVCWSRLSSPLQPLQCFCNQNTSLNATSLPPHVQSSALSPQNEIIGTTPCVGTRDKGHLWAGGYMMGELSDTLSNQPAWTPHLYRVWEAHRLAFLIVLQPHVVFKVSLLPGIEGYFRASRTGFCPKF